MIQAEESEQPFITASVWGLILIILVVTILTSCEPEKKNFPVILHRDTIKQNSQAQKFTIQNNRKQREKEHYKFLKKRVNEPCIFKDILMFIYWKPVKLNFKICGNERG